MDVCAAPSRPGLKRNFLSTRRKIIVLSALNSSKYDNNLKGDTLSAHGKEMMTLLQSEQSYIEVLKDLNNFLKHPVLKGKIDSLDDIISLIDKILTVHSNLYDALMCGQGNLQDAFQKLSSNMNSYVSYSILINLESSNLQKYFELVNDKKIPIFDILHEPMTHIFRYKTFFQNLYYIKPNEVYNDILKAAEYTCERIKSTSSMKKNSLRILQIQRLLIKRQPKILSPERIVLKEGILYKVNSRGTRMNKRVFFLFNDILLCCKILIKSFSFQENDSLLCSSLFPLNTCSVSFVFGSSTSERALFKVTCGYFSYLLLSKVPGESQNWVQEIKAAIGTYQRPPTDFKSKLFRRKNVCSKPRILPFRKKSENLEQKTVSVQSLNVPELQLKPTSLGKLLKVLTCTQ